MPTFSGQFTKIDRDAKFLEDEEVDGISLVEDSDFVKQIRGKLGHYTHGPVDWFPVNWAVSLNQSNINRLASTPYVVAAKPHHTRRYLLYIDSDGEIFMENQTQNIFHVHSNRSIQFPSSDGRYIKDTVLDGYFVHPVDGRLTFVVKDAIRCNGVDLTDRGIIQRMAFIKVFILHLIYFLINLYGIVLFFIRRKEFWSLGPSCIESLRMRHLTSMLSSTNALMNLNKCFKGNLL